MVASAAVVGPRAAAAAPARYELGWSAPPSCPDADAVRRRIDGLLAGAPPHDAPTVRASVEIEPTPTGLRLRLETSQTAGVRELEGRDCGELAETAALIVAIAVDPRVLARLDDPIAPPVPEPPIATVDPGPPPTAVPTPPPPAIEDRPVAPAPTTTAIVAPRPTTAAAPRGRRAPPVALARIQLGLDAGTLPGPTAHVGAALGLGWQRARLELEGDYVARRSLRSRDAPDLSVQAQAWSVGLRGCGIAWQRRRLALPVCGVARGGLLHGRGDGALLPRDARQPWVGIGPGVQLVASLRPRVALVFGLDALVTALRGGFRTDRAVRFAPPWPVALQASAGVVFSSLTRPARGGQPRR